MKYRIFFVVIFIFFSNLLISQSINQKIVLKDSIVNDNLQLNILSEILTDTNIRLVEDKLIKGNNVLVFNDSIKNVDFRKLNQQIDFFFTNKLNKTYKPSDIFNFRSIKEVYGSEITENNQICYFSGVYLIKGSKGNLFYIETKNINGGLIKTLFTEDGFVLWLQLIDRGNWNYSSANVSEFLEKYGIKKDALVKKNLIGVKQIHHFFNE